MVFSSLEFIIVFLPIVLLGDYILRKKNNLSNIWLLVASIIFYTWGEPYYVFLFVGTVVFNWLAALFVKKSRAIGIIAIIVDIFILFIFKYYAWIIGTINGMFSLRIPVLDVHLPIGISFYTFQAISYVADVMSGKVDPQKKLINIGLYISFFPQLIAGPIVRYTDIENQISSRRADYANFSKGVIRFMVGFSKKILIADNLAVIVNKSFELLGAGELGLLFSWLGAIAYTFQIFFDFSGYSDMAIGLGRMFGFVIPENFNMPYIAHSIRDFWHRWHMSLSIWFRDYVYIPLGGNRVSFKRGCLNIMMVWLLTGLWHGANLTFVIWGIIYGILILFEKISSIERYLNNGIVAVVYRLWTLLCIILLWVVFRSASIGEAFSYISVMFDVKRADTGITTLLMYLCEYKVLLVISVILSIFDFSSYMHDNKVYKMTAPTIIFVLFLISVSYLVKGTYSPFLYFNF